MSEMSEQLQLDQRVVDYKLGNFVGIFKNAFTKEFCEDVIKQYEDMAAAGHGQTRFRSEQSARTSKDDTQVFADDIDYIPLRKSTREFNEIFWGKLFPIYEQEYAALKDAGRHNNYSFKIQKTKIGGGYHIWHFESGNRECSNRLLTWILYLNDVQEGGETEFLYQHMRVKPEQGTIVIWPAAFTHTHRGNPPLSNEKYIVTGWTEF
jgi:hypothetical protein